MLVERVTDDLLMARKPSDNKDLSNVMGERFKLRKVIIDDAFKFNECEIYEVRDGNITIYIYAYLDEIGFIETSPYSIKCRLDLASKEEVLSFRSFCR